MSKDAIPGKSSVDELIKAAFADVVLGRGISLRQAQVIDNYRKGVSDAEFDRIPLQEITSDWSQVPLEELDRDCVAHLNAEGFRYYIPALMLALVSHYEPHSMRCIGTLSSLYPKPDGWFYHMDMYAQLNEHQRHAVASYLSALPTLVTMEGEDRVVIPRALRNYWGQFLRPTVDIQVVTGPNSRRG